MKGGQLIIGDKDSRITNSKIKIVLSGNQQDHVIDIDGIGDRDPGNKVLFNTGQVKMYGAERAGKSVLEASVLPGATETKVAAGLNW